MMSAPDLAAGMPLPNREVMPMLRVAYSDTADGQCWTLCGRLAGAWVGELRSLWILVRKRAPRARALVDLKEVTFIDESGEKLLAEMELSGAEFVATGVENKHVIASLRNGASRPLRRTLEDLCAGREEVLRPKGGE
jgi:hypothetical protein